MNCSVESEYLEYDVVIIGGGIAGATVAKKIIKEAKAQPNRKLKIAIVEAGRNTGMSADKYMSHVLAYHKKKAKLPNSPYADNPNAPQPNETDAKQMTGKAEENERISSRSGYLVQRGPLPFLSSYTRALGGTTLHWLGTTPRMLPSDFELKTRYGHGVDWPITYQDLKKYYEEAEHEIIGVSANVADQHYPGVKTKQQREEYFGCNYDYPMESVPQSYLDTYLSKKLHKTEVKFSDPEENFKIKVTSTPAARNSTPRGSYTPVGAVGNSSQGQRCEGNSSCIPICPVQAKYNALKTLNALQRDYGKNQNKNIQVDIITQTVASKIYSENTNCKNKIDYIECKQYRDESSGAYEAVKLKGKVFVLAAHAIENAKLLLASGVANSSDQVGRNLMDHPIILTWGLLKDKIGAYRGPGSTSGIPTFRDGAFRSKHAAFRVEIGNWGWSFPDGAPYSTFDSLLQQSEPAKNSKSLTWGSDLRKKLNEVLPRQFRIAWEFEQIPDQNNRVTIDEKYKDQLGNHRPVISYNVPGYVKAAMKQAREVSRKIHKDLGITKSVYAKDDDQKPKCEPAFAEFYPGTDYTHYAKSKPGYVIYEGKGYAYEGAGHVAGTHRMGFSPEDSVVNHNQQSWDHENLFMVGCGNMPTIGTSNPTLTMTALALQAGENINKYLEGEPLLSLARRCSSEHT